jgi:hypothetical protein
LSKIFLIHVFAKKIQKNSQNNESSPPPPPPPPQK